MERLNCIAKAEFVEVPKCEGEVELRLLKDGTSVPLCELHISLYDIERDEINTSLNHTASSTQSSQ